MSFYFFLYKMQKPCIFYLKIQQFSPTPSTGGCYFQSTLTLSSVS